MSQAPQFKTKFSVNAYDDMSADASASTPLGSFEISASRPESDVSDDERRARCWVHIEFTPVKGRKIKSKEDCSFYGNLSHSLPEYLDDKLGNSDLVEEFIFEAGQKLIARRAQRAQRALEKLNNPTPPKTRVQSK